MTRLFLVVLLGALPLPAQDPDPRSSTDLKAKEPVLRYAHDILRAHEGLRADEVAAVRRVLEGCAEELRGWEWHWMRRQAQRELLSLSGPRDWDATTMSPNGSLIALGGFRKLELRDAVSGEIARILDPGRGWVQHCAFSSDGKRVVVPSFRSIHVFETETGKIVQKISAHRYLVSSVAISPDGSLIASGSGFSQPRPPDSPGGQVLIHDVETGKLLKSWNDTYGVTALAFTPNGKKLVTGSGDLGRVAPPDPGVLRLFEVGTWREIRKFEGHEFWITGVAVGPGGRAMASSSADGTVRVWELDSGAEIARYQGGDGWVRSVSFAPEGLRVAFAGDDRIVRVRDVGLGGRSVDFVGHEHQVNGVSFGPNGRLLSAGGGRRGPGEALVWDVEAGLRGGVIAQAKGRVSSLSLAANGRLVALGIESRGLRGYAEIRDVATGEVVVAHTPRLSIGPVSVQFRPDASRWAVGGFEVEVLDAKGGETFMTARAGQNHGKQTITWSADGTKLAYARGSRGATICDPATGAEIVKTDEHRLRIVNMAFSPSGELLATVNMTGYLSGVNGLVPSTLKFFDTASGGEAWSRVVNGTAFAFSPDGRLVASGGKSGRIVILDIEEGQEVGALPGHVGRVSDLAWSPDGRRLFSAGVDRAVRIWDVAARLELLVLRGHTHAITTLAIGDEGHLVVSADAAGVVREWRTR